MKTIRHIYRQHATTIDCLACIVIPVLIITAIKICVRHGATIDNFLPK